MSIKFKLTPLLKVEFIYVKYSVPTWLEMYIEIEISQCHIMGTL